MTEQQQKAKPLSKEEAKKRNDKDSRPDAKRTTVT